jgi:FKBP-type peptidyl-prolyl cis-trans isomerase FkpA
VRRSFLCAALSALVGCGGGNSSTPSGPSELVIEDVVVGTGAAAASGDTLTVNYVGTLLNGTKFDSSIDAGQPLTFRLGVGAVIAGWDQGLVGMRVGGKRRLTIPPTLAYGNRQVGAIPPNSTLRFEVDLLRIAGK